MIKYRVTKTGKIMEVEEKEAREIWNCPTGDIIEAIEEETWTSPRGVISKYEVIK
jgi:hypothetical protein